MEKIVRNWHLILLPIAIVCTIAIFPITFVSAQTATPTAATVKNFPGCPSGTTNVQQKFDGRGRQAGIDCLGQNGVVLGTIVQSQSAPALAVQNGTAGQCNWGALDFGTCIWNPFLNFIASLIMSIAGMLLTVAGSLFDLLITKTVIDLGGTLQTIGMLDSTSTSGTTIIGPITHVWATFRDVANILIIGMFVYIAMTTILSLPGYDTRRWVAKILIVAVLLNFSMFFTKITIDVSNFVAREFYKTMPGLQLAAQSAVNSSGSPDDRGIPSNTSGNSTTITNTGIAGTFMNDIGISGVWDWKYDTLSELTTQQGPLIMLGYSLGAAFFMLIVAFTLLYASFLLATRAILLVFLLITSSLAFASMLLPGKFAEGAWDKWKTSLINSAVFAPLLMLLLSATLLILNGAPNARGQNTLNAFLLNPTDTNGWTVLFVFIIASGMLFVSIRVANTFALKIAGFNYAAAIPGLGLAAGAAVASFGLRNTVGRGSARLAEMQAARAQELTGEGKHIQAGIANALSGNFSKVGKASFNPINTAAGKQFTSLTGGDKGPLGGILKKASAAGKGGFIADEKATVKAQQEHAEKLAPTKDQQEKIRKEALTNATPEQKQQLNASHIAVESAAAQKDAIQSTLRANHGTAMNTVNNEIKRAAAVAAQNPQNPQSQTELENLIRSREALEVQHQQQIAASEAPLKAAEQTRREVMATIIPKESLPTTTKADNMADIAHRRIANVPWVMATGQTADKDRIAQKVRSAVKKKEQSDIEKARLEALVGNAAATPPPTP